MSPRGHPGSQTLQPWGGLQNQTFLATLTMAFLQLSCGQRKPKAIRSARHRCDMLQRIHLQSEGHLSLVLSLRYRLGDVPPDP